MQGTLWEWNVEKLEGVPSQILVTCPLHAVACLLEIHGYVFMLKTRST